MRVLAPVLLITTGAVLALYGFFALAYRGDAEGGSTYVTLAGHDVDADLVGVISLAVGLAVIGVSVVLLRRPRVRS